MDVAGKLPAEVEALHAYMLERTKELYGESWARAFASLTALSRTGWREPDLRRLLPAATGEEWSELRFAALRRGFRAHLVERGALGQWDFSHAQMRAAVERCNLPDSDRRRRLHAMIADQLESLPPDDPLRQTELMYHLIGSDDRLRAARYYASRLAEAERAGAMRALAGHILAHEGQDPNSGSEWVASLLELEELEQRTSYVLCERCLFDLLDALQDDARVKSRVSLVEAARGRLLDLHARAPDSVEYARYLSVSYNNLGDLYVRLGEPARARSYYEQNLAIAEELRRRASHSAQYARDLSVSYNKLGDLYVRLGEPARARENYDQALAIREQLRRRAPDSAEYARDLSVSYNKLGDLYVRLGEPARARENYDQALAIREQLRRRAPDSAEYARDLSVSYERLGDLYVSLGEPARAR
ncbi:MAG: tetratricopeptide repeat protein, partial [Acidobacteriota bacterium]